MARPTVPTAARTNAEGTCLYCGKPLPAQYDMDDHEYVEQSARTTSEGYAEHRGAWRPKPGAVPRGHGYSAQGYFCTLRCGWRFALVFARAGERLAIPRKTGGNTPA